MTKIQVKNEFVLKVIDALLLNGAYKAIGYLHEKLRVKASRKLYQKKLKDGYDLEILLTIGRPNY